MPKTIIKKAIGDIYTDIERQYFGSRRKDGMPSKTEVKAKNALALIEVLLQEKLALCQQPTSNENHLSINRKQNEINSQITLLKSCQIGYGIEMKIKDLYRAINREAMSDVLISQRDDSRNGYLQGFIISEDGGISFQCKQGFSVFSSQNGNIEQLELKGVLSKDRIPAPENVVNAATELGTLTQNNFNTGMSDLDFCVYLNGISADFFPDSNQIAVYALVDELGMFDHAMNIIQHYKSLFIPPSGMSHLPPFFIDRQNWEPFEDDFGVLRCRCLIADENRQSHSSTSRVNINELKETLIDFAFMVAALEQRKNIYGSCQGAHVGWLLVGGEMTKWNKYMFTEDLSDQDTQQVQHLANSSVEISPELNQPVLEEGERKILDENKYGAKEKVQLVCDSSGITVTTDFDHATVMIHNPDRDLLDPEVEILKMHPLEETATDTIARNPLSLANEDSNPLSTLAKDTIVRTASEAVEQFRYKTLIGTQSHPFKHTYDPKSLKFVSWALGNIGVEFYQF